MKDFTLFSFLIIAIFSSSCQNTEEISNKGPIVFNDSTTIVTETDSQYLKDEFSDLEVKPRVAESLPATVPVSQQSTTNTASISPENKVPVNQSGFTIDYGTFKALLPGISTKEYKKQDPAKDYGVSYQIIEGDLTKTHLVISGVKDIKISQRYQSNLVLKNKDQSLDLKNMGSHITEWSDLKLQKSGNQFIADLSGLQALDFKQISNASLKNAVQKELRSKRANNKTVQEWLNLVSKVRSAKDKPCEIILNNVQWRLTGTDGQGKTINKLVRIDI